MRVLAIDQGTSGTKAVVVDDGVVVASAEETVRPAYLADGRVEQDPAALLASVLDAGRRAVADAGGSIDAVALANQGETVLAWDPVTGDAAHDRDRVAGRARGVRVRRPRRRNATASPPRRASCSTRTSALPRWPGYAGT